MGIQKPRGTQDLLPNVIGNWRYVVRQNSPYLRSVWI